MTLMRPSRVQTGSRQSEAGSELPAGRDAGPGTQEEAGPRAEPALEFESSVESEAEPRAEPSRRFENGVESEAGPRARPARGFKSRAGEKAGLRAEPALGFESRVESEAGAEEGEELPQGPKIGVEFETESYSLGSIPGRRTSLKEVFRRECNNDISEQKQKDSTGEEVEGKLGYKNGEKLGSTQLGKDWELDESTKSSKEESDDTLSSSESVTATVRKELGKGEYCVLCTVPKTPDQDKSSQYSGPENAQKCGRDGAPPIGLYLDTCWLPRSVNREELMRLYLPRGFPSLASTPATTIHNVQHFWDQHLSTRNRFPQSPKMTWQNLNRNVTFLMGSKRLQQLLKSQEELEKKVQKELAIKGQVEQEMIQLNGELMQTRALRKQLVEDHCHMQAEIQPFLVDSHILMGYVPDPTKKKKQVAPIKVWDQQTQQLEQMQWQQQELVSSYESHTLLLREELLRQEEIQAQLKKKIQALNARRTVQITQQEHIESLQKAKPRVQKEAEAQLRRAQGDLVKEWRALKHQLSDVELLLGRSMMGKHNHVLEHAADKSILSFTWQLQRENEQLHKEMVQLVQEAQQLEAQRSRLRKQKQQLQLEQCCLESIKQGRQRQLLNAIPCQKGQSNLKTTLAPLPGTKPRMNSS
ncbi:coiled-coil domain-containing protein 121 [Dromiciops gliroides]|uniref:coiled-coil domain-containing protein 121 n=1 Tax=Dromiciops gliroides TaxID=33562 RepID=UPI001CC4223D|nr:coiled-coil domain-containing protein 121 [Dromiciops gliroides]